MREGETRVFSKLDRMLANVVWKVLFSSIEVNFQSEGEFDHSPALLTVFPGVVHGKKAFRYFTMWKGATQFDDLIRKGWAENIEVTKMYINLQKLKKIKCSLKELNRNGFSDAKAADIRAYRQMIDAQQQLHAHLGDVNLAAVELAAIQEYKSTHEAFLFLVIKQRWIGLEKGMKTPSCFTKASKPEKWKIRYFVLMIRMVVGMILLILLQRPS